MFGLVPRPLSTGGLLPGPGRRWQGTGAEAGPPGLLVVGPEALGDRALDVLGPGPEFLDTGDTDSGFGLFPRSFAGSWQWQSGFALFLLSLA